MSIGNKNFEIVCNWLGWGDPKGGLWFIGPEEGGIFDAGDVQMMAGKRFDYVSGDKNLNFRVAMITAKIVSKLLWVDASEYRKKKLWRRGSKIFNGNIMPLGKKNLCSWPSDYDDLFGIDRDTYWKNRDKILEHRIQKFQEFREKMQPQAVVCFGKMFWDAFRKAFVQSGEGKVTHDHLKLEIYEKDRVILTGHFSRGSHMPNAAVQCVVETLKRWNIDLG